MCLAFKVNYRCNEIPHFNGLVSTSRFPCRKNSHSYTHTDNNFFKGFYLFLERGREGERRGEKHECVAASHAPPTGDPADNPGMCPDWESNRWPFGSQAGTQSTEPHQPGQEAGVCFQITLVGTPTPLDLQVDAGWPRKVVHTWHVPWVPPSLTHRDRPEPRTCGRTNPPSWN